MPLKRLESLYGRLAGHVSPGYKLHRRFIGKSNNWGLEGQKSQRSGFLAKYADFANVFDKRQADVLPEHSQHNLAIEIENN